MSRSGENIDGAIIVPLSSDHFDHGDDEASIRVLPLEFCPRRARLARLFERFALESQGLPSRSGDGEPASV
jgi:hypothetical protein